MATMSCDKTARRGGSGITVNAMHSGAVSSGFKNGVTGFRRAIAYAIYALIGISPEKGADTIVYLAIAPIAWTLRDWLR
jgi:retinol dehydrogenase-14